MIKIFLVATIIFLLIVFILQLKRYLIRDKKESELDEVLLEGDLLDIEKDIVEERVRQKTVSDSIDELKNETERDHSNDS